MACAMRSPISLSCRGSHTTVIRVRRISFGLIEELFCWVDNDASCWASNGASWLVNNGPIWWVDKHLEARARRSPHLPFCAHLFCGLYTPPRASSALAASLAPFWRCSTPTLNSTSSSSPSISFNGQAREGGQSAPSLAVA